jgi:hypothetical protein
MAHGSTAHKLFRTSQLKHFSEEKLEALDPVIRLHTKWLGKTEFERADWGEPTDRKTCRVAEVTEQQLLVSAPNITKIAEYG